VSQKNERRILIVDNSESDRAVYVRYLQAEKKFSYQIIETDTLEAGLASWERNRPDLVLLDINLPDGSGLEFLEAIAQTYPAPKLPVIVMTNQTDTRMLLDAMKRGASDYLFKEDRNSAVFRRCVAHTINELELSRRVARLKQQEILSAEIALRIRAFLNLDDIYQAIVTEVRQFLATDRVIIYQFNPDMSGQIVAESVIRPWKPSLYAQIIDNCLRDNQGIAYQEGKIFAVSDIYHANLTDCHVQLLADFQVRANLVVPILLPQTASQTNPLWGLLIAHQCSGPRHWETDDIEMLQRLSVQLAIALQQSIAYQQLQNELAERKRTESILQKLIVGTSSVAGEAFFPAFVQNMTEILEVPYGLITELVEEQLHTLGFWANGVLQPSISYAAIHTPCEKSLREGQFYCERYVQELFPHDLDLVTMKAEGYLGVALKDHEGNAIGNLCILDTKPIDEHKRAEAIAILQIFAARASAELQRKQADEKLQQLNQYLEVQIEQRTAALQESEITNRTILQTIPDLLLRLRPDGTCLDYIEPRIEKDKFLPIVHHISEVLPPEIVQNTLQVIEQAIATRQLQIHEHQLVKQDRLTHEEIRVLAINDQEVLVIVRDISDRKQAEEQLKKTTDRLAIALKSGSIGYWEWDLAKNICLWDERMYELYGVDQKSNSLAECEILANALYPDDRNSVETLLQQAILGEVEYDTEFRIVHSDSSIHFIKAYGVIVRDTQGNPQSIIGVNFDISDRKQAEENLKTERLRLQLALDAAKMGAWSRSSVSNQLIWSDRVQEIFGFVPGSFSGDPDIFLAMIHPEDRDLVVQSLNHTFATGEPYHLEYRIFRLDGEMRWISVSAILTKMLSKDEELLIGVIADISDQKQAEKALRKSQQFIQTIINTVPLPLFWKDQQSVFLGCNQQLAQMLGLRSPIEIEGKTDFDLSLTEEQAIAYRAGDRRVMESGEAELGTEETHILEDGELNWIETHKAPLRDGDNNVIGVVGMFQNITERKHYELALSQKNTELEELLQLREETLELREDMSNMIVHDLRTPLTTIVLAAGMINKYGDRAGQRALIVRKAGQILDSAKQLEKMIDSLLFMAKLEAGKILFNLTPTDLNRLGSEVIADFELVANSRDIELRSELPNFGKTMLVDATILRRIIGNLMSNALKFSPVGSHVTLSLEYLPKNHFRVTVADTGTGIPEAEKQKIFEKFEIGSLKKNVSQTGLGLAFCKMAVEAQGGTLAIADNHPQGVIFIVEI
jgi:PAS domain S-box-containing protein